MIERIVPDSILAIEEGSATSANIVQVLIILTIFTSYRRWIRFAYLSIMPIGLKLSLRQVVHRLC